MTDQQPTTTEPPAPPAQPEPPAQPKPPTSEPTTPDSANPYQTILEQKDAQINALIDQTNKLTEQITKMISGGMQISDGTPAPDPQPQPSGYGFGKGLVKLAEDDDFSVSTLGNFIGKRD